MSDYLYQQLEDRFRAEIHSGQRPVGSRMPSIRVLCEEEGVSKSTALTTYGRLEAEGLIEARARSGYFVSLPASSFQLGAPAISQPQQTPKLVSSSEVLLDIMRQGAAFDLKPGLSEEGNVQLRRCLANAQRHQSSKEQLYYDEPLGLPELRKQLVRRAGISGVKLHEDQILVTSGCQQGLLLALMACTQPGDVVALESPGFYGAFQLLESLGLRALELPSSAETGLSPDAFELALQHWDIKALITSPNYATPTGALMPDANKQSIWALANEYDVAVIEDDIYGDLCFGSQRPLALKSFDSSGNVILCSSFSKSLSRDLRLGWMFPGKYLEKIQHLKFVTSLATSQTLQQGVSIFLEQGGYDRHLRVMRQKYQQQCKQLHQLVIEHLPMSVSCSQPSGGLALWLELPEEVDTLSLYSCAREQGIMLTPGPLFTSQNRYKHFLRLSFAHEWSCERRQALASLGRLIKNQY